MFDRFLPKQNICLTGKNWLNSIVLSLSKKFNCFNKFKYFKVNLHLDKPHQSYITFKLLYLYAMNMDIALWGKKRKEEKDIFEAAYYEKYDNKILAIRPRAS